MRKLNVHNLGMIISNEVEFKNIIKIELKAYLEQNFVASAAESFLKAIAFGLA